MPIIKLEYNEEKQYCAVPENANFIDVAQSAVDSFNLAIQNSTVRIVDHQNAKIKSVEALQHVISKCADNIDLFLKISFEGSVQSLLTPQILLKFLSENGGNKVLQALKSHKLTGQLTISERRNILHVVVDFIVKEYGHYPSQDVKKEVANVVVSIFPCLGKKQGNNVIEFLYAGRKGWLVHLLKSRRAKDNVTRPTDDNDAEDDESEPNEYTADEAAQDVEYLKITPYDKNTAVLIEEKLKLTSVYRHNMLAGPGVNVVKLFPYLISNPHLILLDYSFMEPSNCTAFAEKWSIYSGHILAALAIHEKDSNFFTTFPPDIEAFLGLLKLVTPKPKGRQGKRNNDNWFQQITDDFITYIPIGTAPKNAMKKNADQPYIFASGHVQANIIQYYIIVEREIITVPTSFKFDEVFDLFFKLHFVLNIHYGDSIKPMMEFVEAFFYESGKVETTDLMDQIFETLNGQLNSNINHA